MNITPRRMACLKWYEERRDVPSPEGRRQTCDTFDSREMNWCLENGLLEVGPQGWHVPSATGRAAFGLG